jgi:hypothetical protein
VRNPVLARARPAGACPDQAFCLHLLLVVGLIGDSINYKTTAVFFFKEFLFVAKVAIIHKKMKKKWRSSLVIFSQFWL